MKKILALMIALCMMALMLPAAAESFSLDGLTSLFGGSEDGENSGFDLSGLTSLFGGSENGESSGFDLSGLISLFGGSGDGESSGFDLSGLTSLFGGSEDGGLDLSGLTNLFSGSEDGGVDLSGLTDLFGSTEGTDGQEYDIGSILSLFGIGEETPVKTVAADGEEQFFGTWVLERVSFSGYEMNLEALAQYGVESAPVVTLDANSITFEVEGGEPETKEISAAEFADGIWNITVDNEPVTVQLSDAGELVVTMSGAELGMDGDAVLVLVPQQ